MRRARVAVRRRSSRPLGPPQDAPRGAQDAPRGPKTPPRRPQDASGRPQEAPRRPQHTARALGDPQGRPRDPPNPLPRSPLASTLDLRQRLEGLAKRCKKHATPPKKGVLEGGGQAESRGPQRADSELVGVPKVLVGKKVLGCRKGLDNFSLEPPAPWSPGRRRNCSTPQAPSREERLSSATPRYVSYVFKSPDGNTSYLLLPGIPLRRCCPPPRRD